MVSVDVQLATAFTKHLVSASRALVACLDRVTSPSRQRQGCSHLGRTMYSVAETSGMEHICCRLPSSPSFAPAETNPTDDRFLLLPTRQLLVVETTTTSVAPTTTTTTTPAEVTTVRAYLDFQRRDSLPSAPSKTDPIFTL